MRHVFRRLLVALLALAFTGGVLGQTVPNAKAAEMHSPEVTHPSHAGHQHQDHHRHQHSQKQDPTTAPCLHCCCIPVVGFPQAPTLSKPAEFAAQPVSYLLSTEAFSGRAVAPDPGIPKRTT